MIAELGLGARLASTFTSAGRRRALLTMIASAVATAVTLAILAVADADGVQRPERYADGGMTRVLGAVIVIVGLQAAGLAATAGRLAAGLRARRLGNLRLLGLSAARTRLVATAETGIAALVGGLAGLVLFEALRPLLARLRVAGQSWPYELLDPGPAARLVTVVTVASLTVALAALPDRLGTRGALIGARGGDTRAPSWWRAAPLAIGLAACAYFRAQGWDDAQAPWMLVGVMLTGVGVVLVVPIFVRLVAEALVRVGRGNVAMIAGRRLQAQPASMNRVVTGLLLGLFVITGARLVVVAFESTPQYIGAASQIEDRQVVNAFAAPGDVGRDVVSAAAVPGVTNVLALPHLGQGNCTDSSPCFDAVVASCAQLSVVAPSARGCRDDAVMLVNDQPGPTRPRLTDSASWTALGPNRQPVGDTLGLPTSSQVISVTEQSALFGVFYIVPPGLEGVSQLVDAGTSHMLIVAAEPGRDLAQRLVDVGIENPSTPWDPADYEIVATLRSLVLAVGILVLGIGLISFAIAAIDRAMQRRGDIVGLQLVGIPGPLLRRVQWVEAAVPIIGGTILAIGSGLLAGAAYLGRDDDPLPWRSIGGLAAAAAIGGLIVSGLTVVAANPTMEPDGIRRE